MSAIYIRDRDEMLEIEFRDIRKYHGSAALMAISVGFRCVQAALRELFGDQAPERQSISVLSGHAGPGFRDAFEFVTRAVTRGAYRVDVNYPAAQYDPHRPQSYAFVVSDTDGRSVEVALREHFLPGEFYDLLKKGRDRTMSEQDAAELRKLMAALSEQALTLPEEQLLSVRRISSSG